MLTHSGRGIVNRLRPWVERVQSPVQRGCGVNADDGEEGGGCAQCSGMRRGWNALDAGREEETPQNVGSAQSSVRLLHTEDVPNMQEAELSPPSFPRHKGARLRWLPDGSGSKMPSLAAARRKRCVPACGVQVHPKLHLEQWRQCSHPPSQMTLPNTRMCKHTGNSPKVQPSKLGVYRSGRKNLHFAQHGSSSMRRQSAWVCGKPAGSGA